MKYDILTNNEESLSIEVVAGKIVSFRNKNVAKKGIRLFENNQIYTTSFVGEISDEDLIKKAFSTKSVGIPYDYQRSELTDFKIINEESLKLPLSSINEAIEQAESELATLASEFVFTGKFIKSINQRTLRNENKKLLERKFGNNEFEYIYKKTGSPNIIDGYFVQSGPELHVQDIIKSHKPFLQAFKNEIKFKAGRYPVLFIDSGQLLGKLTESLSGEKYCNGSALFSGKLNQQILSPQFSLYDINYSPEHSMYRQFDDEGTVRKLNKLPLIENGVMKNIIADLRTAKKYSVEATGNGVRAFDSAVRTGFNMLTYGPGKRSTKEILSSLNECIVVFMGHGGDFTDKGEFSTPLHLAYMMNKGEIVGRLPQLTVKTSTNEMFGSKLIEVGSDGFQKNQEPSIFTEMDVILN